MCFPEEIVDLRIEFADVDNQLDGDFSSGSLAEELNLEYVPFQQVEKSADNKLLCAVSIGCWFEYYSHRVAIKTPDLSYAGDFPDFRREDRVSFRECELVSHGEGAN